MTAMGRYVLCTNKPTHTTSRGTSPISSISRRCCVTIFFLEEAGVEYDLTYIDFSKKERKSDWYMQLNPNGRIPTIVDRSNDNFVVFESGAILWSLAEKYQSFLPTGEKARSEALQWLMFQMSGIVIARQTGKAPRWGLKGTHPLNRHPT